MADTNWQAWGIPVIVIGVLLLLFLALWLLRWHIRRPTYDGTARIDGKLVVITGGNTGIGKETAKDLIRRGGRIIILCRNVEKGKIAAEEISDGSGPPVKVYELDLSSLESVRKCAQKLKEEEPKIDILINNAGVMVTPELPRTREGHEMQFGVNHLGHFLLTLLLIDNVKAAKPSRIVTVSSLAHQGGKIHWDDINFEQNFNTTKAYEQSKLANVLFTKSLAEKLKGAGVTSYSLHPGIVATELDRHVSEVFGSCARGIVNVIRTFFAKSPKLGAQTSIYCAVDEALANQSGLYYSGCKPKKPKPQARNKDDAERLWKLSLEMVGLQGFSM